MLKSFKLKLSARHTACTTCQKGYYQPDKGQTSCIMCDKGYFQENIGQTICDPCPEEYYQPGYGKSECIQCSTGKHPNSNRDGCDCKYFFKCEFT